MKTDRENHSILKTLARSAGFTLVETMIVTMVLGVLASLTVPNLLRARMNANEAAVKEDLRTFSGAAEMFRASSNPVVFPSAISNLTTMDPPYLSDAWDSRVRHEYQFTYTVGQSSQAYALVAAPLEGGGMNTYCVDQTGVLSGTSTGGTSPRATAQGCQGGAVIS